MIIAVPLSLTVYNRCYCQAPHQHRLLLWSVMIAYLICLSPNPPKDGV